MRRFLKGLSVEEWVEDPNAEEEKEELPETDDTTVASADGDSDEGEDEDEEDEEKDPLLLESGRILADFIALTSRNVSSVAE